MIRHALVISEETGVELLLVPQPCGKLRLDLHAPDSAIQVLMDRRSVEAARDFMDRWLKEEKP